MRVSLDMVPGLAPLTPATLAYFRFGGIADTAELAGGPAASRVTRSGHVEFVPSYYQPS